MNINFDNHFKDKKKKPKKATFKKKNLGMKLAYSVLTLDDDISEKTHHDLQGIETKSKKSKDQMKFIDFTTFNDLMNSGKVVNYRNIKEIDEGLFCSKNGEWSNEISKEIDQNIEKAFKLGLVSDKNILLTESDYKNIPERIM